MALENLLIFQTPDCNPGLQNGSNIGSAIIEPIALINILIFPYPGMKSRATKLIGPTALQSPRRWLA